MKILIIAEYMAPAQAIASIRWTKLGKYLAKNHDCQVDILTNKKIYEEGVSGYELYKYDETLSDDLAYFDHVYEIPGTIIPRSIILALNAVKVLRKRRQSQSVAEEAGSGSGGERAVLGDSGFAKRLGDAYLRLKENGYRASFKKARVPWAEYDVVISSYGPKWTHLIAESVKRDNPDLTWIADYRDLVIDAHSDTRTVSKTFAKLHTGSADCVFAVAHDSIPQLYLPDGQRVEVIYNGFDPEEITHRNRKQDDKFILAYTGMLYNDPPNVRDITPVLRALSELIEAGAINKDDIMVSYCGPSSDVFLEQAASYPTVPIEDLGLVSRSEAQRLQDRSSILIFATWNTENSRGALSGKLYEYLSSRVPIVSLCAGDIPDAEPSALVRKAQAGFAYDEVNKDADYPMLVAYLRDKYDEWKRCGMTQQETDADFVGSFEHQAIAERVYSIIADMQKASQ